MGPCLHISYPLYFVVVVAVVFPGFFACFCVSFFFLLFFLFFFFSIQAKFSERLHVCHWFRLITVWVCKYSLSTPSSLDFLSWNAHLSLCQTLPSVGLWMLELSCIEYAQLFLSSTWTYCLVSFQSTLFQSGLLLAETMVWFWIHIWGLYYTIRATNYCLSAKHNHYHLHICVELY